jgi:hypothetical protein
MKEQLFRFADFAICFDARETTVTSALRPDKYGHLAIETAFRRDAHNLVS